MSQLNDFEPLTQPKKKAKPVVKQTKKKGNQQKG